MLVEYGKSNNYARFHTCSPLILNLKSVTMQIDNHSYDAQTTILKGNGALHIGQGACLVYQGQELCKVSHSQL